MGSKAGTVVGSRIAAVLLGRKGTPQFLEHAIAVTEVRIALLNRGYTTWRFEQQVRHAFEHHGKTIDLRPDGLAVSDKRFLFVEADLGHVNRKRFRDKLLSYQRYFESGEFEASFGAQALTVLTVTTGTLRARHLESLCPVVEMPLFRVVAAKELGIAFAGGWK